LLVLVMSLTVAVALSTLAQDRHDGRVAFIVCAVAGVLATALVTAASRSLRG
jgi:hypothetical protein